MTRWPDTIPTAQDVDTTLATLTDDTLLAIIDQAGTLPAAEWRLLRPDQRRALRAANLLAQRARTREQKLGAHAAKLEQRAVAARQQREAQAAADLAPILERKRNEQMYR